MMTNSPYQKKDEQLFAEVQKLKNGDFSNSNAVYELSEKYIYKIINDIVKNHHTTEDLMQEAYIQIYNKIDTLQEVKAFYVWAGRIATNLTLRYIQKNSKEVLATPDEEGETDFIFDTAAEDNENFIPESVLIDREKQRLIAEIIDNLSTEQKICIQYFYYEEMSVNEIAEAMGCSAGTIKSRLNYARKSIKEAVVELDEKHGTRLYSLASAPLFLIVFRAMAEGLLPAAVGAASAVSVGVASVAAGGASASAVGGASASVAGGAGASVAGNAAGAGVASAASTAAKAASVVEKGASAGKINEVKNVVLDILKKAGTDLKTDAKKVAKAVKEMGKTNSEAIKAAFQTGKKEGFKQILKSTGNVLGNTVKGIVVSTISTKAVIVIIVIVIVIIKSTSHPIPPTVPDMPPAEDSFVKGDFFMRDEEVDDDAVEEGNPMKDVFAGDAEQVGEGEQVGEVESEEPEELYYMRINIATYRLDDGRVYYIQYRETASGAGYVDFAPDAGVTFYDDHYNERGGLYKQSDISSLTEESFNKLFDYGEQFFNKGTQVEENLVYLEMNELNEEFLICFEGKEYILTINQVYAGTERKEGELVLISNTEGDHVDLGGNYYYGLGLEGTATPVKSSGDITSATTHPGAAGIADPSEVEGIVIPELETKLPTVEPVSDMETLQAMLYEKYALFDNVTDEIVYERMSDVPCTVYLDDGSVHSVTLAECMFRDWSGYADVDRIEYDQELAQEIFSSYTKRTDSLID